MSVTSPGGHVHVTVGTSTATAMATPTPAPDTGEPQLSVRFTTQLEHLSVTDAPIQLPTRLSRAGLSEVVNHLLATLDSSHVPRPFDFLLNNELVRGPLGEALARHGLSGEAVATLEYVECLPPPRPERSCAHEDWVGGLAAHPSGGNLALAACYNHAVYVWDAHGHRLAELAGHTAAVKAVTWLRGASQQEGQQVLRAASASKDHTVRTWRMVVKPSAEAPTVEAACEASLTGHASSVESIASNPKGDMLCSGAWDGSIHLWSTPPIDGAEANGASTRASKRAKVKADVPTPTAAPPAELSPVASLSGHQGSVNALCWPTATLAYSGSWDGTLREWSIETESTTATLAGQPAILDIDVSLMASLIASAHTDHTLRVWDSRLQQAALRLKLTHPGWVSGVRWCPHQSHLLASTCYDGCVRLWDVRSSIPLHEIKSHEGGKALCVDWDGPERILSGGSDAALRMATIALPGGAS